MVRRLRASSSSDRGLSSLAGKLLPAAGWDRSPWPTGQRHEVAHAQALRVTPRATAGDVTGQNEIDVTMMSYSGAAGLLGPPGSGLAVEPEPSREQTLPCCRCHTDTEASALSAPALRSLRGRALRRLGPRGVSRAGAGCGRLSGSCCRRVTLGRVTQSSHSDPLARPCLDIPSLWLPGNSSVTSQLVPAPGTEPVGTTQLGVRPSSSRGSCAMLRPGLSLLLGLCVASLLPSTPRALGRPARSAARLPVPAQGARLPRPGTGSAGLGPLQLHCCTLLALALLLAALGLGCSLRRKARRQRREEKSWTRSAWPRTCCLAERSPFNEEPIGRQKENSASIKGFLRHLRQRCPRGDALQRGRNNHVWKDLDEEAALFSD
ncbi:uncharacterized protein LOC141728632 [Zonotrichia albicollis]|uniref:uncharacterized protein LOC141728632 n=1 Tax=Zonotrichia albicollis TaxID=44394 RepID=UPI003D80BD33